MSDERIVEELRGAGLEVPADLLPAVLTNCRALLDAAALVRASLSTLAPADPGLEPAATFRPAAAAEPGANDAPER